MKPLFSILMSLFVLGFPLQSQTPAPKGEPSETHGQVTLQVLNLDDSPYLGQVIFSNAQGQAWSAQTNAEGVVEEILLPLNASYTVQAGPYTAAKKIELPNQAYAFVQTGTYTHSGIFLKFYYQDLQNRPLAGEALRAQSLSNGQIYEALTDGQGLAKLFLPFDSAFSLSLPYQPEFDYLRPNPKKGEVQTQTYRFKWIGSKAKEQMLKTQDSLLQAERQAQSQAKSQALNKLKALAQASSIEDYNANDVELLFYQCDEDWTWWLELAQTKAAAYQKILPKKDTFAVLRKRGGLAALQRLRAKNLKPLYVLNASYGTEGYWQDALLDHLMSEQANTWHIYDQSRNKTLKLQAKEAKTLSEYLMQSLRAEQRGQFGQSPDFQALMQAAKAAQTGQALVLLTRCDFKDPDFSSYQTWLKDYAKKHPVHVVLTGFKEMAPDFHHPRSAEDAKTLRQVDVSPHLLTLAHQSGGSLHTPTQSYWDLPKMKAGQTLKINHEVYRLQNDGRFILEGLK